MLIMSKVFDKRINSWNFYVESTFGEYLKFAKKIINNNELQRKRVKRKEKERWSKLKFCCASRSCKDRILSGRRVCSSF